MGLFLLFSCFCGIIIARSYMWIFNKYENVFSVATTIIYYSKENNLELTNLRLQKLLYFVQKDYMKETGNKLFNDEFKAWTYGPVIPKVWSVYKRYVSYSILDYQYGKVLSGEKYDMIVKTIQKYKDVDSFNLVELSHKDSAWFTTKKDEFISYEKIEVDINNES